MGFGVRGWGSAPEREWRRADPKREPHEQIVALALWHVDERPAAAVAVRHGDCAHLVARRALLHGVQRLYGIRVRIRV